MTAVVEAQDVRKRYRASQPWAVDGLTITIQPGEAFGLLGPNGAGKTTMVKMLTGLLFPDEGNLRVFGEDPTHPAARRKTGFSPEDPDFPKFLRAGEVLDYFGRLFGLAEPERGRRVTEAQAWAGLAGERRLVRQYSKGMKQRLGLAQALVGRPQLLILDEPTADLDPVGRRAVRDLILSLKTQGVAILLNSHLLSEVERVCDRVAIIDHGHVLREGQVHDIVPEGKTLEDVFMELVPSRSQGLPSFMVDPPA
ncbi:MAG: ABC transporter ATP-binding protein [Candidatus Dormibacteria bacterium]